MSKLLCAALVLVLTGCSSGFNGEPQTRVPIGDTHWQGDELFANSDGREVAAIICPTAYCTAFDQIRHHDATFDNYQRAYAWLAASLEEGKP